MNIDKNIKFGYFQGPTSMGTGFVCVALQRPEKGAMVRNYKAAFSFYSKGHEFANQFSRTGSRPFTKQVARERALGRLLKSKDVVVNLSFTPDQDPANLQAVFRDALDKSLNLMYTKNRYGVKTTHNVVPNWVRKAISNGTLKFTLTR